ncbi:S9 family peptidase [soil metagenome]
MRTSVSAMRPEHLDLLRAAGRPAPTPDGRHVVVAVSRPDLTSDTGISGLWVIGTDGSEAARRLTNGPGDRAPVLSPDGRLVAFLRSRPGGKPQIHLTALGGGEPVALTDQPLGCGMPVWSPDGSAIAHTARVPEGGRYGSADPDDGDREPPSPEAEAPRLITELAYRRDDLGYIRDQREQVFLIDLPQALTTPADAGSELPDLPLACRQVTSGDHDHTGPAWSPDGRTLAVLAARHETREEDLRSGIYLVAVSGDPADADPADADPANPVPAVEVGDRSLRTAAWLPDGRLVAAGIDVGPSGRDFVGLQTALLVSDAPAGGSGPVALVPLTDATSIDLLTEAGDLVVAGGRVLVRDQCRGGVRLLSVDPDGGLVDGAGAEVLAAGPLVITGHGATADGSVVAVSVADPERVADVAVVEDGHLRMLTDLTAPLRDAGAVQPMVEVQARAADDHPVHGWVVLPDPARYGPGPHPAILTIHGGPHSQYEWGLFDEAQVLAGAGYAVLLCNPRGSSGFGEAHGRAIRGRLGSLDADDVRGFLDHVMGQTDLPVDPERVGVQGGSYGGYMTALPTTRTDRFTAAVVERGYLDPESFVGSSDIGWFFPGEYHGGPEGMAAQSPMRHVGQVRTPTLVIHSEQDWRCPVEQGQRWFTALRTAGVQTQLLLFPGEGHELSRSGGPRHRLQRFQHQLRWWQGHMPTVHINRADD